MYVFTDSTLRYLLKKIKSKIALKSELDNKVDKVNGKGLSDNDFTNAAKQSLENKYSSVEASYSTGMVHIKFSNEDQSNTKTIDLKTGCDMFFYPTIDSELILDSEGNVTIPYAFISKSGSDIGKVTVNIENLTENKNSENVFNVTDNGSELVLEGLSPGNTKVSFTIEGDTEELKANVLGEYSTVIMSLLTIYRSTDASLVPSNISDPKTVVSDFGNGEYEIMLYTSTGTNHLNFSDVQTLTNVSYMSDDITNMYNTYYNCTNLTGNPVCGDKVTNMFGTYAGCINLTGPAICGPNVTDMAGTYYDCISLAGDPVCGSNVTNMYWAYAGCINLTGDPVCGNNVTDMSYAYGGCQNLTGPPVCGPSVTNMDYTYCDCIMLTGSPVCGDKVTNMDSAYRNCQNLTGAPVCGPNVTNMSMTYYGCPNLYGDMYVYSDNISSAGRCFFNRNASKQLNVLVNFGTESYDSFKSAYAFGSSLAWTRAGNGSIYYWNNTANIVIFNMQTTNMYNAFREDNIITKAACGPNVTDMSYTYSGCRSLTGSPVCGDKVTTMANTYQFCRSLTGSSVCGDKVTNMANTYEGCKSLTGSPVCGPNVINMSSAYRDCCKLTGSPVCGNKVTNMSFAYAYCDNLTGPPVCGPNVTMLWNAYSDCYNLSSNGYFYSSKVTNARNCFRVRNTSKRLNLYVHANSTTLFTCLNTSAETSLTGTNITWTEDTANNRHYNTAQNIYIYPVDNVAQKYKENELGIVTYTTTNTAMRPGFIMTDSEGNPISNYTAKINGNQVMLSRNNSSDVVTYVNFYDIKTLTSVSFMAGSITNMSNSFKYCFNLTGRPVCGNNVTNMFSTYYQCNNLTGAPVCGNNVINMHSTYFNCTNLTGSPICGPNVTSVNYTYQNCKNLGHNGYFYSNKVSGAQNCFCGKDNSRRLNLYVPANSTTLTTCLYNNAQSLVGTNITWTSTSANSIYYNSIYYNTSYNIYIYPTIDITNVHRENELILAKYTINTPDAEVYNALPTFTGIEKIDYRTEEVLLDNGDTEITIVKSDENVPDPTRIEFKNQSILLSIDRLKLDNVTDASYMFYNCRNLCQINLNNFNTSTITNMDYMFAGCTSLTRKSFSLGTPYIKSVSGLDMGLPHHFSIPVSNVTMVEISDGKLVSISETFYSVTYKFGEVASIYVIIDKDTGEVEVYSDAPQSAFEIRLYRGGMFDVSNVITASHIFDGCTNLL